MPELYRLTDWSADGSSANLGAYDDLDPEMQSIVMGLAQRIYDGEKITYDPDLLQATVKPYIDGIAKGYGKSLADVDWDTPDAKTLQKLTENVFQFSASKDFHILSDMTAALKGSDGKMRSFDEFRAEVDKMNVKYNQNWLRTEYNQAVASSQAAARWTDYEKHSKSMPFLQYQAVMDGNTRAEHAALNGVIKRVDSDFWDKYYPPNGWGCRCEVIQLPGKNHKETPAEAIKFCKVDDMWKVNVGKKGVVFPKGHPYFMGQCKGCNGTPQNLAVHPQCAACVKATKMCRELIEGDVEIVDNKGNKLPKSTLDKSPAKGFDFKQLGNVINDKMKELNCGSEVSLKIVVREKQVRLFAKNGVMTLAVHFDKTNNGERTVFLHSIRVDEQWQKKGLASQITINMFEQSIKMGANRIKFIASGDGSYAWARCNYSARNKNSIDGIVDKRAQDIIDTYYNTHDEQSPFPMRLLVGYEWSETVLKECSWIHETIITL